MTYTEKELNQFLHGINLSLLSKKSAQHWRYDEETAKEIEWLEALERKVRADKADRKTEPQICDTCKFELYCPEMCEGCCEWDSHYEPKDEPQRNMAEDIVESFGFKAESYRQAKVKTEPQTYITEDRDTQMLDAWQVKLKAEQTEPQTYVINPQEPTNDDKCFECDDFFTCDGQCDEVEDEPQTDAFTKWAKSVADSYRDEPQTDCSWK